MFDRNRRPENRAFWEAIAASNRQRRREAASARREGVRGIIPVELELPVLYVCVSDSAEKPEVFSTAAEAAAWAHARRSGWTSTTAMVYQRWNARISFENLLRQAREEGWYRPGPSPRHEPVGVPNDQRTYVGVAHAGERVRVYADRSDAEAIHFLCQLDPYSPEVLALHAVRMSRLPSEPASPHSDATLRRLRR